MIGPGRGPILREIINTCISLEFEDFHIKAIEKNYNSVIMLRDYIKENEIMLKNRVEIICEDIRSYFCEDKADIMVSELIGSFGDNELSPELICSAER